MIKILNESYFDDIEVKDEDLTAEEPDLTLKEYNKKTSRELIEHKMSESEMVLTFHINSFHKPFDILWHRIERIMKRLKYMFDIYNISLSEPFMTYRSVGFRMLKNKECPVDYTIIQHEGCNLYFFEDKLRKYGIDKVIKNENLGLFVFLDKKLPVFKTAKSAYNFLINLDKCLWKDVTVPKDECFGRCDLYNMNDVYNGTWLINSYPSGNSYVNDDATSIYESILNILPEELAYLLSDIKFSKFEDKDIKKDDLENIIKIADQ